MTTGTTGYCATNLHFIKTLTALLEAHTPQAINWIWWPAGDWSATPKATQLGAISPNSWGTLIPWQPLTAYSLSISSTTGGTTFPGAGNYTYISGTAVNVTAIPQGGYKFRAWQDNTTGLPALDHVELSMSADQNLVAVFSPILHDVAVENVSLPDGIVTAGRPAQVIVTVGNLGDVTETFDVTLYCNNANIASQLVQNLGIGSSVTLSFSWDRTGLRPGTYLLKVAAAPIPGEVDLANNNETIAVNIPSHLNTSNPTVLPFSLMSAMLMGIAGFVTVMLGATLARRRLK